MKEVTKHKQLFVLMEYNVCTGRREKEQVGRRIVKVSLLTAEIPLTTTESYCCVSLTTTT